MIVDDTRFMIVAGYGEINDTSGNLVRFGRCLICCFTILCSYPSLRCISVQDIYIYIHIYKLYKISDRITLYQVTSYWYHISVSYLDLLQQDECELMVVVVMMMMMMRRLSICSTQLWIRMDSLTVTFLYTCSAKLVIEISTDRPTNTPRNI